MWKKPQHWPPPSGPSLETFVVTSPGSQTKGETKTMLPGPLEALGLSRDRNWTSCQKLRKSCWGRCCEPLCHETHQCHSLDPPWTFPGYNLHQDYGKIPSVFLQEKKIIFDSPPPFFGSGANNPKRSKGGHHFRPYRGRYSQEVISFLQNSRWERWLFSPLDCCLNSRFIAMLEKKKKAQADIR